MKLLLDTHVLLCAAGQPRRLSKAARALIDSDDNELFFSAASLWEIVIKHSLGRDDFKADARLLAAGCSTMATASCRSPASTQWRWRACRPFIRIPSTASWSHRRRSKELPSSPPIPRSLSILAQFAPSD